MEDSVESASADSQEESSSGATRKRKMKAALRLTPKNKLSKKQQDEKLENEILHKANKTFSYFEDNREAEDDADVVFSKMVLAEYRGITDVVEKNTVKMKILQLLFEAKHKIKPQHAATQAGPIASTSFASSGQFQLGPSPSYYQSMIPPPWKWRIQDM